MRTFVWLCAFIGAHEVAFAAPVVIGHRGNSGIYPEATQAGYESAAKAADYLECDVVLSSDNVAYCSHEPHMAELTTNIMEAIYRDKYPMNTFRSEEVERIDGTNFYAVSGWFYPDYRSTDVDTLRIKHRFTGKDDTLDAVDPPMKLEDLLKIALESKKGVYLEPKHSDWHYAKFKLDVNKVMMETICKVLGGCTVGQVEGVETDYKPTDDERLTYDSVMFRIEDSEGTRLQVVKEGSGLPVPVILQSFLYEDVLYWHLSGWTTNLEQGTCALLYDANKGASRPYGDTLYRGTEDPSSDEALLIAEDIQGDRLHAVGVKYLGPDKNQLLNTEHYADLVDRAHRDGFEVHAWTFSVDRSNSILSSFDYISDEEGGVEAQPVSPARLVGQEKFLAAQFNGDYRQELEHFISMGLDGFFTDYPVILRDYLNALEDAPECGTSAATGRFGVLLFLGLLGAVFL